MNRKTELRTLDLVARGAVLCLHQTGLSLLLGAAEWVSARGLLVAEYGAFNQGHVHLITATHAVSDCDTVSIYAGESHVASILAAEASALRRADLAAWRLRTESESWRAFWSAELEQARKQPLAVAGAMGAIVFRIEGPDGVAASAEIVASANAGEVIVRYAGSTVGGEKRLSVSPAPEVEAFMRKLAEEIGGDLVVSYVRFSGHGHSKHF